MNKAEITVKGVMGRLSVDGHDVSGAVHDLTLTAGAGKPPVLTLELAPDAVHVNASDGQLLLAPGVTEILTAAGWLPPARPDTAAEDERIARGGYNPADEAGAS